MARPYHEEGGSPQENDQSAAEEAREADSSQTIQTALNSQLAARQGRYIDTNGEGQTEGIEEKHRSSRNVGGGVIGKAVTSSSHHLDSKAAHF